MRLFYGIEVTVFPQGAIKVVAILLQGGSGDLIAIGDEGVVAEELLAQALHESIKMEFSPALSKTFSEDGVVDISIRFFGSTCDDEMHVVDAYMCDNTCASVYPIMNFGRESRDEEIGELNHTTKCDGSGRAFMLHHPYRESGIL